MNELMKAIEAAGYLVSEIADTNDNPTGRWEVLEKRGEFDYRRVAVVEPRS